MKISLLLGLLIPAARASDCTTVRLDQAPFSLEGTEVSNQTGTPACTAHAASVLLSALVPAESSRPRARIGPSLLWAGVFAQSPEAQERLLSATEGRTCGSVRNFWEHGGCRQDTLLSLYQPFRGVRDFTGRETEAWKNERKFSYLRDFIQDLRGKNPDLTKDGVSARVEASLFEMGLGDWAEDWAALSGKAYGPEAFFYHLLVRRCAARGGRIPAHADFAKGVTCENEGFTPEKGAGGSTQKLWEPERFRAALHAGLDHAGPRTLPQAIEFCSGVITVGPDDYIPRRDFPENLDYLNTPAMDRNLAKECRFHAAPVIGRMKREDGRCYFLLQNSFSASCDKYQDYSKNVTCENGKVWVEENELARNILRIVRLREGSN